MVCDDVRDFFFLVLSSAGSERSVSCLCCNVGEGVGEVVGWVGEVVGWVGEGVCALI